MIAPLPRGPFRTILADPPWEERGGGQIKRGADRHYNLMTTDEIAAMPVEFIAHPAGSHLYLWVTNNFLEDGLRVMRAWGHRYISKITWFKDREGLGQYFRGQTEDCLFGVRGDVEFRYLPNGKRAQGSTAIIAPRTRHSEKPEELRRMAELVSWPPRVELFARQAAPGWTAWGLEAPQVSESST